MWKRLICLFVNVCTVCTEVFLAPGSLRCLPSTVLSPVNTRGQMEGGVCGGVGVGEGEDNVHCIIYPFSSMSMLCAHFPVTFQRLRGKKKATIQCNGEKDLQHSTIELKEAWRMKQMPRLTLSFLSCYLSVQLSVLITWTRDGEHNSKPRLLNCTRSS